MNQLQAKWFTSVASSCDLDLVLSRTKTTCSRLLGHRNLVQIFKYTNSNMHTKASMLGLLFVDYMISDIAIVTGKHTL